MSFLIQNRPSRQRLSYDECLEDKGEDYQNCSVPYSVLSCVRSYAHSCEHLLLLN